MIIKPILISDNSCTDLFSAGHHSVIARIDWCSSPVVSVDVDESQTVDLRVGGFKYAQLFILFGLGLLVMHIIFSLFTDIDYIIYITVPIVLLLAYFISIGKRKYLTLYELNLK